MSGRGRGWYYKQKYGGGGRGRGGGGRGGGGDRDYEDTGARGGYQDQDTSEPPQKWSRPADDASPPASARGAPPATPAVSGSSADLAAVLRRIDGAGYKAYHDIEGAWRFGDGFTLIVDHVQADPFAQPSRCRVQIPAAVAALPRELWSSRIRKIAVCDYLTRSFGAAVAAAGADVRQESGGWSGEKGGEMTVDAPGQHVLERSSVLIDGSGGVEARFTVALPARGRSVLGGWATTILVHNLPKYVRAGLFGETLDTRAAMAHVATVEDTQALRDQLPALGLAAFVGDGAVLARESGASDGPMRTAEAVQFRAPDSLAVQVTLPNLGPVRGLGVRRGVTLIVGGGFHGKSTLLEALEAGVYNKVPGDGRELVAADPTAVKIRAEDGRRVEAVDIAAFISNLPYGRDTKAFRSDDASGSTSQAANIQESLEMGSGCLLLDEDTCATNFMIRDARMQALVARDKEPITPFLAKIRALAGRGVSTVLVIGGSGDYFDVADTVLCMEAFLPRDVTAEARAIAERFGASAAAAAATPEYGSVTPRIPLALNPPGTSGRPKITTRSKALISFGDQDIDLAAVEQLAEKSQTRAVADAVALLAGQCPGRGQTLAQMIAELDARIDRQGLDVLAPDKKFGNYARPRRFEVAAAINRLRTAQMRQAM